MTIGTRWLPRRIVLILSMPALAALHAAAACPGGAAWCEDFEHGAARWTGGPTLRAQPGSGNHLLLVRGDAPALLLPASETAPHTGSAHFIEARLRPAAGSNASPRQGFILARYTDPANWLGFGLDLTPGSDRVAIDISRMKDGKLVRLKQANAELNAPGSFNTVRLDVDGSALTLYLNGQRIIGTEEPGAAGQVGVLARGGDFELDDLRIGDAAVAPERIGLAHMGNRLSLQAGDAPQRYPVRAIGKEGATTLAFSVASSDPAVASAAVDGDALVVRALRPGNATITVSSTADANLALAIDTAVGPAFAAPDQAYALAGRVLPAAGAREVQVDTLLRLRLDGAPTLGTSGSIRIFRSADNALVDVIRLGSELDEIGTPRDGFRRVVRFNPIQVDGSDVTIHPHDARLAYDTDYYVQVDGDVLRGAALGGKPFTGIGKGAGWTFRTRARMPAGTTFSVDDDGPADFRTVQGALNHAMLHVARQTPVTINIANGRYDGLLYLRGKDKLTLRGQSRDGVQLAVFNNDALNPGAGSGQAPLAPGATGGRSAFLIEDADLVRLDRLSVINTTVRGKSRGGQAEAVNFASDGRFVATDASFISQQDTILVKGYSWFYRSLVAGDVDFIWGYNHAALFEDSEIRSLGDSTNRGNGGYIVQARTALEDDPGFVFLNDRITHGPGPGGTDVPPGSSYLARPGPITSWDKVSYINCRIDRHIAAKGWSGQPRGGAGWNEYRSMDMDGKPLDLSARTGGHVLADGEAQRFLSRQRVFAAFDHGKGWDPSPLINQ
jgi:pectin methylesterase-like acyl-CoA thioesterase